MINIADMIVVAMATCKQHGHQQEVHLSGLERCITSLRVVSKIFISNERLGPQQFLVQQSVSVKPHTGGVKMFLEKNRA